MAFTFAQTTWPVLAAKNKGVLPIISFASGSAPFSRSSFVILGRFLSTAQCKAVLSAYCKLRNICSKAMFYTIEVIDEIFV